MISPSRSLPLLILLTAATAYGQSESGNAAMQGTALDPNGGPVAAAKVILQSEETGYKRETETDGQGRYFVPVLPVGSYRVEVSDGPSSHRG
jgi:hypothetical protein